MTRSQQFDAEVKELIRGKIRMNMPEPKMIDASFCSDLENDFFSFSWSDFKIPSGKISVESWISNNGFKICKKSEATCLLRVGEICAESGCWIIGKTKNFWLKPY